MSTSSISVICVMTLLCGVASEELQLKFAVTRDVRLKCTPTKVNRRRVDSVFAVQIVKKSVDPDKKDNVLATASPSDVSPSKFLKGIHPLHHVEGNFNNQRKWEAWLQLTLFRVDQTDWHNGIYACQVHYLDHPADLNFTTWETQLQYTDNAGLPDGSEGFTISSGESVYASCQFDLHNRVEKTLSTDSVVPKFMTISDVSNTHLASWGNQGQDSDQTISKGGLLPPRIRHTQVAIIFESLIPDASRCCDWSAFHCSAQISFNGMSVDSLQSSFTSIPKDVCRGTGREMQEPDTFTESNDLAEVSSDEYSDRCLIVRCTILIVVGTLFATLSVAVLAIYILWGSNQRRSRISPDVSLRKSEDETAGQKGVQKNSHSEDESKMKRISIISASSTKSVGIDEVGVVDLGIQMRGQFSGTSSA